MKSSYKEYFDKAQQQKGLKPLPKATRSPVVKREIQTAKSKSNKVWIAILSLGFITTLCGSYYLDEVESLLKRVEINLFASASAEEKPPKANPAESEKTPSNGETKNVSTDGAAKEPSSNDVAEQDAELDHFSHLRERKVELDQREENLNKLEAELNQQRLDVEKKLEELEQVRRKISSVLEEKVQIDEQKVENLVQFYSNMKPPQAAKIIESIDEDLAVQVMARMKKKTAADIMNLLKPEKAQTISEKYVGYRK